MFCVCEDKEEEIGGALDLFPQTPPTSFSLPTQTVRTISHPSRDSTPESPSHSELCNPVWAAFSLASKFGSPLPASMFATPSWLKFLNLSGNPRLKFLASPVFCSTCSDVLFPGTLRVCSDWPSAC